ncbi:MAG TPA: hypothetical protein VEV38_05965 [Candidatus Eremiobacteraceae bacterium]|nr:hypothetical protein [Candidatus Eremiobacteraceae bacterium]
MTSTRSKPIAFLALAIALCAACSPARRPPAGYQWGLPVYPGAVVVGKTSAKASFVLYRTDDPVETVDAWYVAKLPTSVSHAYDLAHDRSTFAVFDAHDRKTIHIEREGSATAILITDLSNP